MRTRSGPQSAGTGTAGARRAACAGARVVATRAGPSALPHAAGNAAAPRTPMRAREIRMGGAVWQGPPRSGPPGGQALRARRPPADAQVVDRLLRILVLLALVATAGGCGARPVAP